MLANCQMPSMVVRLYSGRVKSCAYATRLSPRAAMRRTLASPVMASAARLGSGKFHSQITHTNEKSVIARSNGGSTTEKLTSPPLPANVTANSVMRAMNSRASPNIVRRACGNSLDFQSKYEDARAQTTENNSTR